MLRIGKSQEIANQTGKKNNGSAHHNEGQNPKKGGSVALKSGSAFAQC
jgi:hypothetical protein